MVKIGQLIALAGLLIGLTACGHYGRYSHSCKGEHQCGQKSCDGHKCEHKYHKKGGLDHKFKKMDTNSDGKVSKDEFQGKFAKMDANSDGFLTKDEMKNYRKSKCKGMKKEDKK